MKRTTIATRLLVLVLCFMMASASVLTASAKSSGVGTITKVVYYADGEYLKTDLESDGVPPYSHHTSVTIIDGPRKITDWDENGTDYYIVTKYRVEWELD